MWIFLCCMWLLIFFSLIYASIDSYFQILHNNDVPGFDNFWWLGDGEIVLCGMMSSLLCRFGFYCILMISLIYALINHIFMMSFFDHCHAFCPLSRPRSPVTAIWMAYRFIKMSYVFIDLCLIDSNFLDFHCI